MNLTCANLLAREANDSWRCGHSLSDHDRKDA